MKLDKIERQTIIDLEKDIKVFFETFILEILRDSFSDFKINKSVLISKNNDIISIGNKVGDNKKRLLFKDEIDIRITLIFECLKYNQETCLKDNRVTLNLCMYKFYLNKPLIERSTHFNLACENKYTIVNSLLNRLKEHLLKYSIKSITDILKDRCEVKFYKTARWIAIEN